ncbi:MAG TPA: molybdopterin-dependent oxidoreductase [Geopsychrobacteraceae bacterium]
MERRDFLQLLGLFSGAAMLPGCSENRSAGKLVSYLVPPDEGVLPGAALYLPSTCGECPAGCGLTVRVSEGRAVKLEGRAGHPVNDGGLCMRGQAALWRLYHPERLRNPLRRDGAGQFQPLSWDEALTLVVEELEQARQEGRANLLLSGRTTGTLTELQQHFCRQLGVEPLPQFEIFSHAALRKAYGILFGQAELPHYRIDQADLLLSIGADLLETFVSPVGYARQFSRAIKQDGFQWLHAEPHYSLTGANATERLVLNPGSEAALLSFLLLRIESSGQEGRLPRQLLRALPAVSAGQAARLTGLAEERLERLAKQLLLAERPLLIAGGIATGQPNGLQTALLAGLLQQQLGMIGSRIEFARAENYAAVGSLHDLQRLAERLEQDRVGVLLVCAADPLARAPAALDLPGKFKRAGLRVGLCDLFDDSARQFDLLLPLSHPLESWGDAVPRKGVLSLLKPALDPLHDSRSAGEVWLELLRRSAKPAESASYQEYLFDVWHRRLDERQLQQFAEQGYLSLPVAAVPLRLQAERAAGQLAGAETAVAAPWSLVLAPSIRSFDGRSGSLPLLSELPDPLSTVSYGRWLAMAPAAAQALQLEDRDLVRVAAGDWSADLPVRLQPGLAASVLMIQGDLLPEASLPIDPRSGELVRVLDGVRLEKLGSAAQLAILAGSSSQHGRGLIPDPAHHAEIPPEQSRFYRAHPHKEYRWAMTVDLELCIGCAACAAACYVENNVPVVGRRDHLRGREMSWLRIEPFYDQAGRAGFLPMLCQHCHNAPCEPVCPVYAAYHNPEGLNVQVYQRCVGTRYCSNNCPYKVRRFNWWQPQWQAPLEQMRNPDLAARDRGVMEKCTFCVQRIRRARDRARDEERPIRDGEVVTACGQSCPTGAIRFGNLLDEQSAVYRLARSERAYRVFAELGTEPSVYYLRKG